MILMFSMYLYTTAYAYVCRLIIYLNLALAHSTIMKFIEQFVFITFFLGSTAVVENVYLNCSYVVYVHTYCVYRLIVSILNCMKI